MPIEVTRQRYAPGARRPILIFPKSHALARNVKATAMRFGALLLEGVLPCAVLIYPENIGSKSGGASRMERI